MDVKDLALQSQRFHKSAPQHSKYRIFALIGQGQFGRVFCASVRPTGELVALKELSHHSAPTNKFLRELWSLITLRHTNIVTCQALEHTATGRYLVMDYCEGGSLRSLLDQENSLSLVEALRLAVSILAGLEYVHRQGVVHCDIKPDNILLTLSNSGWQPRLSDFGIARRLPSAATPGLQTEIANDSGVGSPAYMAPERFYGLYSPASDLYAVGILLFEMLSGYRPFTGLPGRLMWSHLNERLQMPAILPEPLQRILKKSLEKLPGRRYRSAAEMAKALRAAIDDPEVKPLKYRRLPLDKPSAIPSLIKPQREEVYRKLLPQPTRLLGSTGPHIYSALGSEIRLWPEFPESSVKIHLSQAVENLQPYPQGCLIKTCEKLYWLNMGAGEPQCLLKPQTGDFTVAAEPRGRWLAVAVTGQLQIYSLRALQEAASKGPVSPKTSISFNEPTLPQLMCLDSRHLLGIWQDKTHKQTQFKVYTRRGVLLGCLKIPVLFDQLIISGEPHTLFGIEKSQKPIAYRIKLHPYQITRILLDAHPTGIAALEKGYVLANPQGKIIFLDAQGQRTGYLKGPKNPLAITPWGDRGLAITNQDEDKAYIYCLKINSRPQMEAQREE